MNNKENDIIYTAQDIEAYVSGRLSALQMHAMEKAALDDSFLAEAMEGYGMMKSEDWNNELASLKTGFEKNNRQAIVVPLTKRNNNWWKIAAAVLLLGGTATISYLMLNKNNKEEVAKNIPVENKTTAVNATPDSVLANTNVAGKTESLNDTQTAEVKQNKPVDAIIADKNTTVAGRTNTKSLHAAERTVASDKTNNPLFKDRNDAVAAEKKAAGENFVYRPQKQMAFDSIGLANKYNTDDSKDYLAKRIPTPNSLGYTNNTPIYKNSTNNIASTPPSALYDVLKDKNGNSTAFSKAKEEVQFNHNFRAQVLGPDNTPLPFANISIKNDNFGTYADVKGNFNLVSTDSLLTVEVKAAGYQPKFYTLQSFAQQNKIVLAEDNSNYKYQKVEANSADVASRSKISRKATLLKDSVVNVEPADGWDNYNTYVNNNIEIPEDILTKDIHGQVELSFDVKSNGTIANIKVDKSLCDNCDELAKRLIQQGPQWKVKKGKKGKGKVTVQF